MSYIPVENLDAWDDDVVPSGKLRMDLLDERLKARLASRKVELAAQNTLLPASIPAAQPIKTSRTVK